MAAATTVGHLAGATRSQPVAGGALAKLTRWCRPHPWTAEAHALAEVSQQAVASYTGATQPLRGATDQAVQQLREQLPALGHEAAGTAELLARAEALAAPITTCRGWLEALVAAQPAPHRLLGPWDLRWPTGSAPLAATLPAIAEHRYQESLAASREAEACLVAWFAALARRREVDQWLADTAAALELLRPGEELLGLCESVPPTLERLAALEQQGRQVAARVAACSARCREHVSRLAPLTRRTRAAWHAGFRGRRHAAAQRAHLTEVLRRNEALANETLDEVTRWLARARDVLGNVQRRVATALGDPAPWLARREEARALRAARARLRAEHAWLLATAADGAAAQFHAALAVRSRLGRIAAGWVPDPPAQPAGCLPGLVGHLLARLSAWRRR